MRRYIDVCERYGFDIDAYHGTTADFDTFDPSLTRDIGMHFGTAAQADKATRDWFNKPKDNAHIIPVSLRLRNPLRVRDLFDTTRTRYINRAKAFTLETPGFIPNREEHDEIYAAAKEADRARRRAGGDWGSLDSRKKEYQKPAEDAAKAFWQAIQKSAERQGYDGFVYNNRVEGKGDSYVVFDPRNVRARHASFANLDSARLLDSQNMREWINVFEAVAQEESVPTTLYRGFGGKDGQYVGQQWGDAVYLTSNLDIATMYGRKGGVKRAVLPTTLRVASANDDAVAKIAHDSSPSNLAKELGIDAIYNSSSQWVNKVSPYEFILFEKPSVSFSPLSPVEDARYRHVIELLKDIPIAESAEQEIAMNQQVRQASRTVMERIYHGQDPYHEIELGGHGDFYVYRSREDLGLDLEFLLMLGVRKSMTIGMSGMVMDFGQDVFGYRKGLAIYCMQNFSIDEMRRTVNSVGFMQTIEHEFLHMLDNARTQDRIVARGEIDTRNNKAGYYNDPAEFNAYYHDIAKDMMAVIAAAQANPEEAKDYLDLYGFTGEWQADLRRLVSKNVYTQSFVQHLTPERRKALLKRLYRLHQQMMTTLHQTPLAKAA